MVKKSKEVRTYLKEKYKKNPYPTPEKIEKYSKKCDLPIKEIQYFFHSNRMKENYIENIILEERIKHLKKNL